MTVLGDIQMKGGDSDGSVATLERAIEVWRSLDGPTAEARLFPLAQLMVDVYGLEPERLWFSVFEGDDKVPADDEAAAGSPLRAVLGDLATAPGCRRGGADHRGRDDHPGAVMVTHQRKGAGDDGGSRAGQDGARSSQTTARPTPPRSCSSFARAIRRRSRTGPTCCGPAWR